MRMNKSSKHCYRADGSSETKRTGLEEPKMWEEGQKQRRTCLQHIGRFYDWKSMEVRDIHGQAIDDLLRKQSWSVD